MCIEFTNTFYLTSDYTTGTAVTARTPMRPALPRQRIEEGKNVLHWLISSPEPKAHGELLGSRNVYRPSVNIYSLTLWYPHLKSFHSFIMKLGHNAYNDKLEVNFEHELIWTRNQVMRSKTMSCWKITLVNALAPTIFYSKIIKHNYKAYYYNF